MNLLAHAAALIVGAAIGTALGLVIAAAIYGIYTLVTDTWWDYRCNPHPLSDRAVSSALTTRPALAAAVSGHFHLTARRTRETGSCTVELVDSDGGVLARSHGRNVDAAFDALEIPATAPAA